MKRIGMAASKIARTHVQAYWFHVVWLSTLFSFLIFLLGAAAISVILMVLAYFKVGGILPIASAQGWPVFKTCLTFLAAAVLLLDLYAIFLNLRDTPGQQPNS